MKVDAKIARIVTIFGWDSGEEGFGFLFKKRVQDEKKKKKRLNAVIKGILNPRSILNLKGLSLSVFEVKGIIATKDAAGTALLYGAVCSIVSIIIPFLNSNGIKIDFYPDFQQTQPDFHISCIIRVRLIHIIYLLVKENKKNN